MQTTLDRINLVIGSVYISGSNDAFPQTNALQQAGICHVLKLYKDEPHWPAPFVVCDHTIKDSAPVSLEQLQHGVSFIQSCQNDNQPVLVSCRYGVSRSSTFVLAYLVEACRYDLRAAWMLLRHRHPKAYPAFELWRSLLQHYGQPYTLDDVAHWLVE